MMHHIDPETLRERLRLAQEERDADYFTRREAAKEYDAWAKANRVKKEWHER